MKHFQWSRYLAIVKKEIIQIKRDRPSLGIALVAPLMMLLLFGYAVNTDVENISLAVWDQSKTASSRELVDQFTTTGIFQLHQYVDSYRELELLMDEGKIDIGLVFPPDYNEQLSTEQPTSVQVLINGADPTVARTAVSNAQIIVQQHAISLQEEKLIKQGMGKLEMPLQAETRVLFNPEMKSVVFNVPALIGLILQNVTILLTAFSLVREKERGTMEQLIVTPVRPLELILGKLTPYVVIGLISFTTVLLVGTYWFQVSIKGSIGLLIVLSLLFLLTALMLGIFISTISKTQLQAMQLTFVVLLPSVLLSGFIFPRETMPFLIKWLGGLIPLTYFLEILRGIFLKGVDLQVLWKEALSMAGFFVVICTVASLKFRKQLD